jgi:hypothetical protein
MNNRLYVVAYVGTMLGLAVYNIYPAIRPDVGEGKKDNETKDNETKNDNETDIEANENNENNEN